VAWRQGSALPGGHGLAIGLCRRGRRRTQSLSAATLDRCDAAMRKGRSEFRNTQGLLTLLLDCGIRQVDSGNAKHHNELMVPIDSLDKTMQWEARV